MAIYSFDAPRGEGIDGYDLHGVEDDPCAAIDAGDELAAALARLQPLERAVLLAVRRDGVAPEEAAARLSLSTAEVDAMLTEAERKVRRERRERARPCRPAPGAGLSQPVGTVVVRRSRPLSRERWIKVSMDGPPSRRWRRYARWLWESVRGPVPQGRCVIHLDGDTSNDDLGNLVLGVHGDRAYLAQQRRIAAGLDPWGPTRRGAEHHNRQRSRARDLLGELRADSWYVVRRSASELVGPYERAADAYAYLGVPRPAGWASSRRSWIAPQLGWPQLPCGSALILHALVEAGDAGLETAQVRERSLALQALLGMTPACDAYAALVPLRRAGLVVSRRLGRPSNRSVRRSTPAASACRGPYTLDAVLRGREARPLLEEGCRIRWETPCRS